MEMRASLIGLDRGALKAALLNAGVPAERIALGTGCAAVPDTI